MEIDATFTCAYCLQVDAIVVDGTGGLHQHYIEDCQICCRPNDLHIEVDEEMTEADVQAETA
ncbi:MAG: CPXCG motif-containing cysteine-rich protein [Bacteroidetes bacterium]|nr:CPXCG motif-containing cysteine-rich protein [Bacteroidota bacterium]